MTNPPPDAESPSLEAFDDSPIEEPASGLEWVVQSAVDLDTGKPVVMVRPGSEEVVLAPDVHRDMGIACITAGARAESEAAFVRLLRDSGFEQEVMLRRQLKELFARY